MVVKVQIVRDGVVVVVFSVEEILETNEEKCMCKEEEGNDSLIQEKVSGPSEDGLFILQHIVDASNEGRDRWKSRMSEDERNE